jgi:thiol-disulfide isomerase/thioredoxin
VQRAETRKARKYGITGTETETLELESVGMAGGMDRFAEESALLFEAYAAYWDLEDRAVIEKARHGRAEVILVEARAKITLPILQEQVDSQLATHRRGRPGLQQDDVFAQLLGKPGPEWEAKDLDGKVHATRHYRGRIVILDFWNRGCGWCIRAMPQLEAIQEEFKAQPVQILGMNLDEDENDARLVVEQMGISYPTVRAIGLTEGYHVGGIPHVVILDREGKIADIHIGYAPTLRERLSQSVRAILDRK